MALSGRILIMFQCTRNAEKMKCLTRFTTMELHGLTKKYPKGIEPSYANPEYWQKLFDTTINKALADVTSA